MKWPRDFLCPGPVAWIFHQTSVRAVSANISRTTNAAGAWSSSDHLWRHTRPVRGSSTSLWPQWISTSYQLSVSRRLCWSVGLSRSSIL